MKGTIDDLLSKIRRNPRQVRFRELSRVCEHFFGGARQLGGSHRIYGTPWPGNPRINIQNSKRMAKVYQVKQVLAAIDKLENSDESKS